MKKSKIAAVVLAGTLTATAMLAGTYAWQLISSEATNEIKDELNPGGRLHDDFDGSNKDVYVENFTDRTDGANIYARIRLDEFLEIGPLAGQPDNDSNGKATTKSLIDGAVYNQKNTWTTYLWDEDASEFRDYMNLLTGGNTTYMPTFNKNKDSLAADINGTLGGVDKDITTPTDAYDDYQDWQQVTTLVGTEVYDADTDDTDEGMPTDTQIADATTPNAYGELEIDIESDGEADVIIEKDVTHTATQTLSAELISMDTWLNDKNAAPGPYWVYDSDGWVYWALAIEPQTATGCLLTGVEVNPSASFADEYYYAINVVAQFATAGDWGSGEFTTIDETTGKITKGSGDGFYSTEDGGITARGLYLLEKVSNATKSITISVSEDTPIPAEGLTGVTGSNTATFTAEVKQGASVLTEGVTWSVQGQTDTANTTISQAGVLTIGENETASSITVVATSQGTPTVQKEYIVLIDNWYTVAVTQTGDYPEYAAQGSKRTFAATVQERGATDATIGVTWSVVDVNGNAIDTTTTGTYIDNKGVLYIGEDETATELKVIATCAKDTTVTGEYTVRNIIGTYEYINKHMPVGTNETVTIDGIAWYLMYREEDSKGLLWASDNVKSIGQKAFDESTSTDKTVDNIWNTSSMRAYLNGEGEDGFLYSLTELKGKVVAYDTYARTEYNTSADGVTSDNVEGEGSPYIKSTDKVFLLSEADLNGGFNKGLEDKELTVNPYDYTIRDAEGNGVQLVTDANTSLKTSSTGLYWLRSPRNYGDGVAMCFYHGEVNYTYFGNTGGYSRPALWVNLTSTQ